MLNLFIVIFMDQVPILSRYYYFINNNLFNLYIVILMNQVQILIQILIRYAVYITSFHTL